MAAVPINTLLTTGMDIFGFVDLQIGIVTNEAEADTSRPSYCPWCRYKS